MSDGRSEDVMAAWERRIQKDRAARRRRQFMRKPWVVGLGVFVIASLVGSGVLLFEHFETRGLPREDTVVVDREATGETRNCGHRLGRLFAGQEPVYRYTYRSADPPPGYAEEFTRVEPCTERAMGEEFTVVRVVHDDGAMSVRYHHPSTVWEALYTPLVIAVPGGLGIFLILWLLDWNERRAGRRHRRGRTNEGR